MSLEPTTNFRDSNGVDLGSKLVTKDYLISVYPSIGEQIGIPPELWVWGDSLAGRLGTNNTSSGSTPVTTFAGGTNWKQVSGGRAHTLAIKTDGTLWSWGDNFNGRLGTNDTIARSTPVTTFAGGTNWKQVSGGNRGFSAAIKTDGTLWTWGSGGDGQLGTNDTTDRSTPVTTFAGGTNWKQVSCGYDFTTAIKTDGTLWTWGHGYRGQLGNDYISSISVVTPVTTFAGGTNWADTATTEPEDLYTLSTSTNSTAAIKTDGTLWTWGNGSNGKLGTNDLIIKSTPVTTFAGGTNWKQVSTGRTHTAAIKTDGTLWTWGNGTTGQLGTNDLTTRSTPVTTFAGGTDWKQVSSGNIHTAAIKTDGTLWTWGNGTTGQLGTNNTFPNRSTPVTTFAGGTNWKQVSSGGYHTAAIKTDGTLWTWGSGGDGQLGTNNTFPNRSTPVTTFAGGTDWKQVSAATGYRNTTAAIKTDGTLWTWGNGFDGQLGTNDTTTRSTPVTTFAGGTNWKQVSCGYKHTAAIKTDGTLWTWGNNSDGQLGNAITTNVSTPVTTFAGGTNWKQVSGGNRNTVALRDDGVNKELYGFGFNRENQLGTNNQASFNISTPITTFAGGTNWKQVSAAVGRQFAAAIKTDGTLWTWGYGDNGRLGNANTTSRFTPVTTFAGGTNWKQVSTGREFTSAIKTDGTLWVWGNGARGQLGNTNTTSNPQNRSTPITTFAGGTNWKQVSSGYYHTAAIKTDGTLWTWGDAQRGALGNARTSSPSERSTPVTTFAGGTNWKQVHCGQDYTAAIRSVDF